MVIIKASHEIKAVLLKKFPLPILLLGCYPAYLPSKSSEIMNYRLHELYCFYFLISNRNDEHIRRTINYILMNY